MTTRRIIKVRHYRPVDGATAPKTPTIPIRPQEKQSNTLLPLFLAVVVPFGLILVLYVMQHLPANPPEIDLSRRVIFAVASVLGLYGAGMIGYALGVGNSKWQALSQPEAIAEGIRRRRRNVLITVIGVVLIVVGSWFEDLTLVDRVA